MKCNNERKAFFYIFWFSSSNTSNVCCYLIITKLLYSSKFQFVCTKRFIQDRRLKNCVLINNVINKGAYIHTDLSRFLYRFYLLCLNNNFIFLCFVTYVCCNPCFIKIIHYVDIIIISEHKNWLHV